MKSEFGGHRFDAVSMTLGHHNDLRDRFLWYFYDINDIAHTTGTVPLTDRVEKGYKEVQMSIIGGYNDSDWIKGWSAMLNGFSLFINSRMEETLSKVRFWNRYTFIKKSFKLFQPISLIPDQKTLMRIEVCQSNGKLLNEPFTQCDEVEKAGHKRS